MIRDEIVATARSWLGTKFHHQGRVPHAGLDCAGLIVCLARKFDLSEFDVAGYPHAPDGQLMRACDANMTRITVDDVLPADVLLFSFADLNQPQPAHMALVGDYLHGGVSIIHAFARARRVIETRLDDVWRKRIVASYRLPGVA